MIKLWLIRIITVVGMSIGTGVVGVLSGFPIYGYVPSWKATLIVSAPSDIVNILFVDYYWSSEDPSSDTLYIQTKAGEYYSIHKGEWTRIPPLPDGHGISAFRRIMKGDGTQLVAITSGDLAFELVDNHWSPLTIKEGQFRDAPPAACVGSWPSHPPIAETPIDSAGFVFEHAMADVYRCYVVDPDGRVEHWSRVTDAFSLMQTLGISGIAGAVLGGLVGSAIIWRGSKSNTVPNKACTGRGSAPGFRRLLANFGAIMTRTLPVRPAGNAYR